MPNTISVSPEQPDKLVVNGCDLVNRTELSTSQNRELQRYIDANAHLLGFLDKPKNENEESIDNKYGKFKYNTIERSSVITTPRATGVGDYDYEGNQASRVSAPSPASSDYYRRKGVSWSDINNPRPRSHSPKRFTHDLKAETQNPYPDSSNFDRPINGNNNNNAKINEVSVQRPYSPAYSTSDKRRTPYDYDQYQTHQHQQPPQSLTHRVESPWSSSSVWSRDSQPKEYSKEEFKGFKQPNIAAYSTFERHPDDYNRYDTHRYLEQHQKDQTLDDSKKFYGYGDHKVSGIELQTQRWTGGEVVTDPNLVRKSLKPRRIYYSPIGDGVVNADGVELKRGPKDMTPYLDIRHERYVEKGSSGQAGRRLIEETWCDGSGSGGDINKNGHLPKNNGAGDRDTNRIPNGRNTPYDNGGLNNEGPHSEKFKPQRDGDGKEPADYNKPAPEKAYKPLLAGFPVDNNDDLISGPSGRNSALSIGTDGLPREGWTKRFIVNPRELINQYANETQTIIFDLDDHTPKTYTTTKEVIRESPAPFRK